MRPRAAFAVAALLLVLTAGVHRWTASTPDVPLPRPLALFPGVVADWTGQRDLPDGIMVRDPNADDFFVRSYVRGGTTVWLSVAYYRRQWESRRLLAATQIEPGAGFIQPRHGTYQVPLDGAPGRAATAATLVLRRGEERYALLYWYQLGDRTFSSTLRYRAALLVNSLLRRRSDGALIRVATVTRGGTADPFSDLSWFVKDVYPELLRSLPR